MKIIEILNGFHAGADIYPETITLIKNQRDFGKGMVDYFRQSKDRDFAIALVEKFIEVRKQPGGDMPCEHLMLACYILGLHGNIADSLKIWEAKIADFDTYCGLDAELVMFAGILETKAFLTQQASKDAKDALTYLDGIDDLDDYFSIETLPWYI